MYFDPAYYWRVLCHVWGLREWPGRRRTLTRLLLLVPLEYLFNAACFLLDYLFFPALWRQAVRRPVFIVGHARSGTTLCHRLMSADGDTFSYFLYWEMFFPSLIQKKVIRALGTVDARLLSEFVNTLPAQPVKLSVAPGRLVLKVRGLGADAEINGIDADEFPLLPHVDAGAYAARVDPQILREMIGLVEFAAASDDSRPVLAGVLMRFEDDRVTLAAADGFRLAVRDGELLAPVAERLDIIVPARALRELARILGDRVDPIELSVTPNRGQLVVRVDGIEFFSRLIDGTFPDFRQIVPREFATRIDLGRDDFLTAVRRAGFFARDNNDVVRIGAKAGDDELMPGSVEVSATAAERGNSQSELRTVCPSAVASHHSKNGSRSAIMAVVPGSRPPSSPRPVVDAGRTRTSYTRRGVPR